MMSLFLSRRLFMRLEVHNCAGNDGMHDGCLVDVGKLLLSYEKLKLLMSVFLAVCCRHCTCYGLPQQPAANLLLTWLSGMRAVGLGCWQVDFARKMVWTDPTSLLVTEAFSVETLPMSGQTSPAGQVEF